MNGAGTTEYQHAQNSNPIKYCTSALNPCT